MNIKVRTIEIDADTATALEERAAARGVSVSDLLSELIEVESALSDLEGLRESGQGPWAAEILAEDARALSDFRQTGIGVPGEEVTAWIQSWGTSGELPTPKPRKL
jgi:predicted transcriptional regulator